jgi:hypothetical protein
LSGDGEFEGTGWDVGEGEVSVSGGDGDALRRGGSIEGKDDVGVGDFSAVGIGNDAGDAAKRDLAGGAGELRVRRGGLLLGMGAMKRATEEKAQGEASEDSPVEARERAAVILHEQKNAFDTLSNTVLRVLL